MCICIVDMLYPYLIDEHCYIGVFRCCYDDSGMILASNERNLALGRGMMSLLNVDKTESTYEFEAIISMTCCHADLIATGVTTLADCAEYMALRPGAGSGGFVNDLCTCIIEPLVTSLAL